MGAVGIREFDGRPTRFGTAGYTMDNLFVLYDRVSNSVWYPGDEAELLAVGGAMKGSRLPFVAEPAPVSLGEWLDEHPDSTVLLPSEEDHRRIERARLGR